MPVTSLPTTATIFQKLRAPLMLKVADNGHLSLFFEDHTFKPFSIDFTSGKNRHRIKDIGIKQPLARAIGIKGNKKPSVIDATAGLGSDALAIAALGCEVTLIEQSDIVGQLLQDALTRAAQCKAMCDIIARMHLHIGNSIALIPQLPQHDVIYIDPMFPASDKSAKVKKPMQILQNIIGHQSEAELLAIAKQYAQRVVLKRPRRLKEPPPKECQVIETKTTQFWIFQA